MSDAWLLVTHHASHSFLWFGELMAVQNNHGQVLPTASNNIEKFHEPVLEAHVVVLQVS